VPLDGGMACDVMAAMAVMAVMAVACVAMVTICRVPSPTKFIPYKSDLRPSVSLICDREVLLRRNNLPSYHPDQDNNKQDQRAGTETFGHFRALSGTFGHFRALSGTFGHFSARRQSY
jgi:hypothetical protein